MPRRKKHSRLPNGYGSIRYLGKNRKNPYAVHPPANIDGDRPAALCYVDIISRNLQPNEIKAFRSLFL